MKILIDPITVEGSVTHTQTKWTIVEILNDGVVNRVDIPYGVGLLSIDYIPINQKSDFLITSTRKLSNGDVLDSWTDKCSFSTSTSKLPTRVCTPKISYGEGLDIALNVNEILLTSSDKIDFIGSNIHKLTSWSFRNTSGEILYERNNSKDDLQSISVSKDYFVNQGVILVDVVYHMEDNIDSFTGKIDFNLSSLESSSDIYLYLGDDNKAVYKDTDTFVTFFKPENTIDEYTVKVVANDNDVLLDIVTTEDTFMFKCDGLPVSSKITISVNTEFLANVNTHKQRPGITKEYIIVDKPITRTNIDIDNVSTSVLNTISPAVNIESGSTIELEGNTIPMIIRASKKLHLYYINRGRFIDVYGEGIVLETDSDITILKGTRIRELDNSVLVVAYNIKYTSNGNKATRFKIFSVNNKEDILDRFNLLRTETVTYSSSLTNTQEQLFFNAPKNKILSWSRTNELGTTVNNLLYTDTNVSIDTSNDTIATVSDVTIDVDSSQHMIDYLDGTTYRIKRVIDDTLLQKLTLSSLTEALSVITTTGDLYLFSNKNDITTMRLIK